MIAKEKAEALFYKHYYLLENKYPQDKTVLFAKQCALVTVNEMIKLNGEYYLQNKDSKVDYSYYCKVNGELFEVKQEIEKL